MPLDPNESRLMQMNYCRNYIIIVIRGCCDRNRLIVYSKRSQSDLETRIIAQLQRTVIAYNLELNIFDHSIKNHRIFTWRFLRKCSATWFRLWSGRYYIGSKFMKLAKSYGIYCSGPEFILPVI